jgi:phage-related minor tail protein
VAFTELYEPAYLEKFEMLFVESGTGYDCLVSSNYENIIKGIGAGLDDTAEAFDFLGLYSTCKTVFEKVNESVEKTTDNLTECVNNATEGLKNASKMFPECGEDISELISKASENVLNIASDLMDTVENVILDADAILNDNSDLIRDINNFLTNIPKGIINDSKNVSKLLIILASLGCGIIALLILFKFVKDGGNNGK